MYENPFKRKNGLVESWQELCIQVWTVQSHNRNLLAHIISEDAPPLNTKMSKTRLKQNTRVNIFPTEVELIKGIFIFEYNKLIQGSTSIVYGILHRDFWTPAFQKQIDYRESEFMCFWELYTYGRLDHLRVVSTLVLEGFFRSLYPKVFDKRQNKDLDWSPKLCIASSISAHCLEHEGHNNETNHFTMSHHEVERFIPIRKKLDPLSIVKDYATVPRLEYR